MKMKETICDNMGELGGENAKWKKSDTEQIPHDSLYIL